MGREGGRAAGLTGSPLECLTLLTRSQTSRRSLTVFLIIVKKKMKKNVHNRGGGGVVGRVDGGHRGRMNAIS